MTAPQQDHANAQDQDPDRRPRPPRVDASSAALGASLRAAVPFVRHLGLSYGSISDHVAEVLLSPDPPLFNHLGTLHAGALYTAAETASGALMVAVLGDRLPRVVPVVTNVTAAYQRPARGEVRAIATHSADVATVRNTIDNSVDTNVDSGSGSRAIGSRTAQTFDTVVTLKSGQTVLATFGVTWHLTTRTTGRDTNATRQGSKVDANSETTS